MKNIFSRIISPNTITSIPTVESMDIDILSVAISSLTHLEDIANSATEAHLYSAYHGVQGGMDIIQEGFGDFVNACIKYFKSLMQKIADMFNGVIMFIKAFVGDFESFMKKYKSDILSKEPDFTITGFDYHFEGNVPNISVIQNIVSGYNTDLSDFVKNPTKEHTIDIRNKYGSDEFYDSIRGKCIGKGPMNDVDFTMNLHKIFRNGASDPKDILVDKKKVSDSMTEYSKTKSLLDSTTKYRRELESLMGSFMNFFNEGTHVYYSGKQKVIAYDTLTADAKRDERKEIEYTDSALVAYGSFYDHKFSQARKLSQIAIIAITAKVNAIKEQMHQHKKIIRGAVL